jgi:iron complex outermembrane recepter protein
MTATRLLRSVSFTGIAISMLASVPALAQEQAEDSVALEDIVVTAQRREQNLQDVPISVATIDGDSLAAVNSGGADIRALAGRVPSLNIESSFGRTFPRFYIRGLGNTDFDLNASQPVSVVYDDVVLENPILKGFPVFDVDRVEVLRGPQGTLFGRNTPAGIVKFDTVRPDAEGGYLRASYARFNTVNVEGAAGGQLSDTISARVSALYQRRGNWVDNLNDPGSNDLEGFEDFAARLQLQFEPSDALTLRLVGQVRVFEGTARLFRANSFRTGSNELIFRTGTNGAAAPVVAFDRRTVRTDGINFQELENYNVGATIEYDLGGATLTSVTSYWTGQLDSRGDIDGGAGNQFGPTQGPGFIPFSAQSQDNVPSLNQFTQELRIASNNSDGLRYQFGIFYFNEKLNIESFDFGTPTDLVPSAIAVQRQDSDALGVFGNLSYEFDNGLTIQGGIRYNRDERDFVAARPVDNRPGFLGFGGPVTPQLASVEDDVITWDLAAVFEASDDVNLFARIASGYRAPSIQGRLLFGRTNSIADSETTMSYEAGIKSTLADGRVRFNLTGYYFTTDDLQLTAVGGVSNFTTLLNAAQVEGYGFEAELQARPTQGLTLTAGLSYNRNEIQDPNAFVAGCGAPCTVLDPQRPGSPGIFSINGNQLPQSPRWIANWTAGYEHPVGNGHVYVFTDWYYRSRIQFFLYRSVEFNDASLIEGGLRVGYRTDRFDVALFGRNITNDVSAVGGIDFNNLTAFVNEPRIWGIEAGIRF